VHAGTTCECVSVRVYSTERASSACVGARAHNTTRTCTRGCTRARARARAPIPQGVKGGHWLGKRAVVDRFLAVCLVCVGMVVIVVVVVVALTWHWYHQSQLALCASSCSIACIHWLRYVLCGVSIEFSCAYLIPPVHAYMMSHFTRVHDGMVCQDICHGMSFLHARKLVHRDLKPVCNMAPLLLLYIVAVGADIATCTCTPTSTPCARTTHTHFSPYLHARPRSLALLSSAAALPPRTCACACACRRTSLSPTRAKLRSAISVCPGG
jgi:hypothetical protein